MNRLWVRALAVGVLVILVAVLLKFMPPIVVLAVFVAESRSCTRRAAVVRGRPSCEPASTSWA